jgi:hypothetical protein
MDQKSGWPIWAIGLFAATSLSGSDARTSPVIDLDAFIVEETAQTQQETLSPLSLRVDSLFGQETSVWEIPRSFTVLSPQQMELMQVDSYETLERAGAGMQRINYFGLAGSPFIRGALAGTYFNGMLRAYQRNEMPMSFGALEGLEIIKGPVPASFVPTLVGGAVNQRPKQPFFDKRRGSVELGVGAWNAFRVALDHGEPLLLMGQPAAYRFSYTGSRSDRYYQSVEHDFDSLYGALKMRLSERHRLFVAAELYDFRSSEVPGINRPTPELIRTRSYVIGEPPLLTSGDWAGETVRPLLEFPFNLVVNPQLHALAIPGDVARARIPSDQLGRLLHLQDPAVLGSLYRVLAEEDVPEFARWAIGPAQSLLEAVEQIPQDVYLYTDDYFAAGGEVLTVKLPRDNVLSDPRDRADSVNALMAIDLETRLDGGGRLLARLYGESLQTDKVSSYGFAMQTQQRILHGRLEWNQEPGRTEDILTLGMDIRYAEAEMLQDFDAEPFSRRDLSRDGISGNSVVRAGGQRGPDGLNHWSSFGNASQWSNSLQVDLFSGGSIPVNHQVKVHYGARGGINFWETELPGAVDRASISQRTERADAHDTVVWQAHLNPVITVSPVLNLYGTVQLGKAISPGDGGTLSGRDTFTDVALYEAGLKVRRTDGGLYGSVALYRWEQSTFSNRDAAARPLAGQGMEAELYFAPSETVAIVASVTTQRVTIETGLLDFGAIPQSEQGWALNAGILNAADGRTAPLNPDLVLAGVPEQSAQAHLVWTPSPAWVISLGPIWRDAFYHDMQRAMRIPASVIWNASMKWEGERVWVRLTVENLFDEAYWIGQEPVFSAGTLVLQGTPLGWEVSAGWRF